MNNYYDNFLEALSERYPRKVDLVVALMDILPIEKESIYRRLRKDILFSTEEVMQIAGAWNISLDNIVSTIPHKTRPFQFSLVDYVNPSEDDYKLLEQFVGTLTLAAQDPESEWTEISDSLPGSIYNKSEHLLRFCTMKWLYKYGSPEESVPLSEIRVPERTRQLEREYVDRIHDIPKVNFIFDTRFIEHLVDDIVYSRSIRTVTDDELVTLKGELLELVDQMEDFALKGYFPDTGNKFFFYLSHTHVETEYIFLTSQYVNMSIVKMLERNGVLAFDKTILDRLKNTIHAAKRLSVLMSLSNRLELIRFFDKQRETIEAMK